MNEDTVRKLREVLSLMASDPAGAADMLEGMAAKLLEQARGLRALAAEGRPPNVGGMGDSARIQVVGPGGEIKRDVNTRGRP